jgi:PadR family transcriptional regulator PadR
MKLLQREVYLSFWKVHILLHAAEHPIIGQWMLKELRHHGYDVSPGTLYPIFHRMEQAGWLLGTSDPSRGKKAPREYVITDLGREALALIERQVAELTRELQEHAK